jgi:hypothetical protein
MAGNYGTSGYGIGGNSKVASMGTGASNPFVALAQFIVGRMAEPRGAAQDKAQEQQLANTGGQDINAEHSSPFGVADTMGSQMMPGAEKMLPVNWKPLATAPGQISNQPVNIDSSQPSYDTSRLSNYVNYMKYRGGY